MILDWKDAYLGCRSVVVQGLDVESSVAVGFLDTHISHALSCISAHVCQGEEGVERGIDSMIANPFVWGIH